MSQTDKRSDDKRHYWWERDLCHKETRDQMIKDMIGGKRIYVINRQEIR